MRYWAGNRNQSSNRHSMFMEVAGVFLGAIIALNVSKAATADERTRDICIGAGIGALAGRGLRGGFGAALGKAVESQEKEIGKFTEKQKKAVREKRIDRG